MDAAQPAHAEDCLPVGVPWLSRLGDWAFASLWGFGHWRRSAVPGAEPQVPGKAEGAMRNGLQARVGVLVTKTGHSKTAQHGSVLTFLHLCDCRTLAGVLAFFQDFLGWKITIPRSRS